MHYYYIHTISYFIGNNRQDNIQYCIDNLNKIKYDFNDFNNSESSSEEESEL